MKKTALILAVAAVCAMFTACDNNTSSSGNGGGSAGGSQVSEPAASSDVSDSSSDSTKAAADKTKALLDAVEFPSMIEVTESNLDPYYGIDSKDLTEYSAYICPSGVGPDEFGVFVAKDADAAKKVEEALKKRVESQDKIYRDYPAADEYVYKLDDCFVNVSGNSVFYAICADNSKAKELLG